MITYTEKGAGLHETIRRAGHLLREENGAWVSSDDVVVQAIIDNYSLDNAREYVKNEIDRKAKDVQDKFVASLVYSVGEMSSWPIKFAQAEAYLNSGNAADAPLLALETTAVRSLADVAARVIANGQGYQAFTGACAKVRSMHKDAVSVLGTFEAISAYDYLTGWPG